MVHFSKFLLDYTGNVSIARCFLFKLEGKMLQFLVTSGTYRALEVIKKINVSVPLFTLQLFLFF